MICVAAIWERDDVGEVDVVGCMNPSEGWNVDVKGFVGLFFGACELRGREGVKLSLASGLNRIG